MAKISEYPKSTSFTANDVLLKDGSGGTRIITWEDAAAQFGRQIGVPAIQTDIATLKTEASDTASDVAALEESVSAAKDDIAALQSTTKTQGTQISSLEAKDLEQDEKIGENADGIAQADKEIEAIKKSVSDLSQKIDDTALDVLFRFPRTGKIYTVKIPKFSANQTTVCEKLDDNAGLVCEPSTDSVEGQDDYADIPLFRWYNCNYVRDQYGHAAPTAIEGLSEDYVTSGNVDVGVIQMAPYIKWDNSNEAYTILSITDSPKDGYTLWSTARSNGVHYPYVIHSKYFSGGASDGLLRSLPGLAPARNQSHNNIITNYAKKGDGYFGAGEDRNTWQIVFTLIKYATKSSQAKFAGCTAYNYQYPASIQRTEKLTYFPLTKAQATNLVIGSGVSVGYGAKSNDNTTVNTDRGVSTMHAYADNAIILKIEDLDEENSAVYLDITDGFDTMPVALSETLSAPITLSTMFWYSGATDAVKAHHDGSPGSNTDSKRPYRVQGVEYAVGGYFAAANVELMFQADGSSKSVLVAPAGQKNTSDEAAIRSTHTNVGTIPGGNPPTGDFWIGDIDMDVETCVTWASAEGSGSNTGVGDNLYGGGTSVAVNTLREYLRCGYIMVRSNSGSSCTLCWNGLGSSGWHFLTAD